MDWRRHILRSLDVAWCLPFPQKLNCTDDLHRLSISSSIRRKCLRWHRTALETFWRRSIFRLSQWRTIPCHCPRRRAHWLKTCFFFLFWCPLVINIKIRNCLFTCPVCIEYLVRFYLIVWKWEDEQSSHANRADSERKFNLPIYRHYHWS